MTTAMGGRYELLGPLAKGGMAEILLARATGPSGFERLFAVKRILPEHANDPEHVRMFFDEARNAATLSHHRIVQVFDIEMQGGVLLYVMEYLHGQSLATILERTPKLPLAAALAVAIAVADALAYAHGRPSPIVHRDVAPTNVMITYDGNVKLIDFGIAKAAGNQSRTAFGSFKGRLGYSSPEQVRCEPVDARADVYSLALVLYELVTGRPALTGANEDDLLDKMADARIPPPRIVDPGFPVELDAILMKALARAPEHRFASARAFGEALEGYARGAGLHVSEYGMAKLMSELFARELAPWQAARTTGLSLEQFVVRETLKDRPATPDSRPPAHPRSGADGPREAKRARRRRRAIVRATIVVALGAAAFAIARLALG